MAASRSESCRPDQGVDELNEPTHKAVTPLGAHLLELLNRAGVDANQDRWTDDVEHHPMSEMIVRQLAELDYMFYGDYFRWKVGGDGDNGEILMYELDVLFDMYDKLERRDPWIFRNQQER